MCRGLSTHIAQTALEELSRVTNIVKECLLFGLIKDHKIIQFPNDEQSYLEIQNNPGVVFCFELKKKVIEETKKMPKPMTIISEVTILKALPNAKKDSLAFPRVFAGSNSTTLSELHLDIYAVIRPYLFRYYQINNKLLPISFDHSKNSLQPNELRVEYQKIFLNKDEKNCPYSLEYISEEGKEGSLAFDDNLTLEQFLNQYHIGKRLMLNKTQEILAFKIQLIFSSSVDHENLKLQKCLLQEPPIGKTGQEKGITIYNCLSVFSNEEILDKDNEWYCNVCKKHQQAFKRMELFKTPQILILHLKRFKTTRISNFGSFYYESGSAKICYFIDYPVEGLNLNKYVISNSTNQIYDLFAVSNHYGGMGGGHYTAFCLNHFDNNWYDFDDNDVSKIDKTKVPSEASYLLFYRRRNLPIVSNP